MARHAHEFQCTECDWFNYPVLRDNMHGNYVIRCGGKKRGTTLNYPDDPASVCGHEHYRVIKAGVVTDDRHNKNLGASEVINVVPSACQEKKRELSPIQRLRQMEATGLNKSEVHHATPSTQTTTGARAHRHRAVHLLRRDEDRPSGRGPEGRRTVLR